MEQIKMTVALNLKNARTESKLTRDDAATKLNIDSRTLGHYETGRSEAKFELLAEMSKLYDKPIGYFFGEHEVLTGTELNNVLMDRIILDLIDDGVLDTDIDFEDLDKSTQQILLGALNNHISKIIDTKKGA